MPNNGFILGIKVVRTDFAHPQHCHQIPISGTSLHTLVTSVAQMAATNQVSKGGREKNWPEQGHQLKTAHPGPNPICHWVSMVSQKNKWYPGIHLNHARRHSYIYIYIYLLTFSLRSLAASRLMFESDHISRQSIQAEPTLFRGFPSKPPKGWVPTKKKHKKHNNTRKTKKNTGQCSPDMSAHPSPAPHSFASAPRRGGVPLLGATGWPCRRR